MGQSQSTTEKRLDQRDRVFLSGRMIQQYIVPIRTKRYLDGRCVRERMRRGERNVKINRKLVQWHKSKQGKKSERMKRVSE